MDDVIPSGIWCWLHHINRLPDIRKALPEGVVYLTFDFDPNPSGHRSIRIEAAGHNSRVSGNAWQRGRRAQRQPDVDPGRFE